jgi:hypothetical protein
MSHPGTDSGVNSGDNAHAPSVHSMQHVKATLAHLLWSQSGARDQLSDSWRSLAEIHLRIGVEHTANCDVPIGNAGHKFLGEYGTLLGHAAAMFDAVNPSIDGLLDRCQAVRMRRDRQSSLMGQLNQQARARYTWAHGLERNCSVHSRRKNTLMIFVGVSPFRESGSGKVSSCPLIVA